MGETDERLAELVRQLERYVDHQIRASGELDDKIEVILSVELGLSGGGIALLAAIHPTFSFPFAFAAWAALVVTFGLLMLFIAALTMLHAYVGLTPRTAPRIDPGIDPEWSAAAAQDDSWTLSHVRHAVIKGLRSRAQENEAELARVGQLRRVSVYLAIGGLVAYAAGSFIFFQT